MVGAGCEKRRKKLKSCRPFNLNFDSDRSSARMPIRVCRTVIRSNDKFDVWDENGRCEASFLSVCRLTRWSASDSSFSGQNGVISVGVVFFFQVGHITVKDLTLTLAEFTKVYHPSMLPRAR
jgi:hypothetical protein